MKKITLLFILVIALFLSVNNEITAQTTSASLGAGTSSSATRGPFQRSDNNSSSVFSRANMVYTQAEVLTTLGISAGSTISQINWDLGSSNVITASGNATLNIYMKNSAVANVTGQLWSDIIDPASGSVLVGTYTFNTTNNFPGATGFMSFPLNVANFVYTGGSIEIAVDWDCSGLVPADPLQPNLLFDGNGSLNWRWDATAHSSLIYRSGSSSIPTDLTVSNNLKSERVNTQFVYTLPPSCAVPMNLASANIAETTADLSWDAVSGASTYNWKIVAAGAGSGATAIASGTATTNSAAATGLANFTSYDLHVEADCGANGTSGFSAAYNFMTATSTGGTLNTATIGTGTSSSSTRGPIQVSGGTSTTQYSRFVHIYTAAELSAAGITSGALITQVLWDLASTNTITSGTGTFQVYIKNSSATVATTDTWTNLIAGSTLAVNNVYDVNNNFPGVQGWMPFTFIAPFAYTGGALEIAVDWSFSIPTGTGFTNTDGDGLKWRWDATATDLVVKKTSSSAPSTTIDDLKAERANIQIVYSVLTCADPTGLTTANVTATSADLSWMSSGATNYNWLVVAAGAGSGGTAVDSGMTTDTFATTTALAASTSYDLYVQADCGTVGVSAFAGPYNFTTACPGSLAATVTNSVTNVSCFGGSDGAINLTVTGGVPPFTYAWSNGATTEDVSGLAAGSYTVTITNANACSSTSTISVTEPMALVVTTSSVSDTAGAGVGSATAIATGGTTPYTYTWDGNAGMATLSGLMSGTYSVIVTDANGCTATDDATVGTVNTTNIDYVTNLSIAPNPTKGNVTIDLELSKNADVAISIYTITGVLIADFGKENTAKQTQQIDLSNYAEGLYLIRFVIDNQVITKKMVLGK